MFKRFFSACVVCCLAERSMAAEETPAVFQAREIKIGEVTQDSAIVRVRLTGMWIG